MRFFEQLSYFFVEVFSAIQSAMEQMWVATKKVAESLTPSKDPESFWQRFFHDD